MNKMVQKTLKAIREQTKAEAPRLLLATLALLIVGLMMNPTESNFFQDTRPVAAAPLKKKAPINISVADLKSPNQR